MKLICNSTKYIDDMQTSVLPTSAMQCLNIESDDVSALMSHVKSLEHVYKTEQNAPWEILQFSTA